MNRSRTRSRGPIDWQRVHERLDHCALALRNSPAHSPEEIKAVLDERARVLARVPFRPPNASEVIEVATFTLADERLAIETRFCRRIVIRWDYTPVPGAPDFLFGVTNLYGDVLALYDLRVLFGNARGPGSGPSPLLVLGEVRDEMGLIADSVGEVRALRIADIFEPPGTWDGIGRHYLRGVTEDALIVVDGAALLGDDRLIIEQTEEPGA